MRVFREAWNASWGGHSNRPVPADVDTTYSLPTNLHTLGFALADLLATHEDLRATLAGCHDGVTTRGTGKRAVHRGGGSG